MIIDYTATLPTKRMAAGMLILDSARRVLLVQPSYKDHWEIPGGAVNHGESPWAAACREVQEELGLELGDRPARLVAVDWVPARDTRTEGLSMVFDGGFLGPAQIAKIQLPAHELRGYQFCTPSQARKRLSPLLARRVDACLTALAAIEAGAGVLYLEDGYCIGSGKGSTQNIWAVRTSSAYRH